MPFKSRAQQGYLESDSSPLTEGQKREFEQSTNFTKLPAKLRGRVNKLKAPRKK